MRTHFFAGATGRYLLYSREARLFAQPFDVSTATVTGDPVVVAERLAEDRLGKSGASLAGHHILVYRPASYDVGQLVWFNRSGSGAATAVSCFSSRPTGR